MASSDRTANRIVDEATFEHFPWIMATFSLCLSPSFPPAIYRNEFYFYCANVSSVFKSQMKGGSEGASGVSWSQPLISKVPVALMKLKVVDNAEDADFPARCAF